MNAVASEPLRGAADTFASLPRLTSALWALHRVLVGAMLVYLVLPVVVAVPASLTSGRILRFPPDGLSLRWYEDFFSRGAWTEGSLTSLQIGFAVAIVTLGLATSAAIALVRATGGGKSQLLSYYLMPLIMPSIVTALAAFLWLNTLGLAYNPVGIAIGHVVFALPYVVLVLVAAFQSFDWELDRAAQASGARWWQRVRDVVVPLVRPALMTGLLFAFIVSFTELVFAWFMHSLSTTTLPVTMWSGIRYEVSPTTAAAASLIILGISTVFLVFLGAKSLFAIVQRRAARQVEGGLAPPPGASHRA